MREIYLVQSNLMRRISLREGNSKEGMDFANVEDLIRYFKRDPEGVALRQRKNLNVILQLDNDYDRKNLEERLPTVGFKKAFVSYELPYEKAKSRYALNR